MPDTLRDDIEAAFEEHEPEAETPTETVPDAPDDAPPPEDPPESAQAPPDAEETGPEDPPARPERPERPRDAKGRFLSSETHPDDVERYPTLTEDRVERPPEGWRPTAREGWAELPAEIRREIHRRELDIATTQQQTAAQRELAERFERVVRPYEPLMAARGVMDPMEGLQGLLKTAAGLQTGSAPQKAQLVGQLIKDYGVDVNALAEVIEGQPPSAAVSPDPQLDTRLKPIEAFMERIENQIGESERRTMAEAAQSLEAFASDAEFLPDVRQDMADLLQLATDRGRTMSLQEAYDTACRLNPEVRGLMEQRESAQRETAERESTQRKAEMANASPRGRQPAPTAPSAQNGTLRDDILQAIDRLES